MSETVLGGEGGALRWSLVGQEQVHGFCTVGLAAVCCLHTCAAEILGKIPFVCGATFLPM